MLAVAACLAAGAVSFADDPGAMVGLWLTEDKKDEDSSRAHVKVVEENGRYRGAIVWLEKPNYPEHDEKGMGGQPRVDRNNPDPDQRSQPVLGLEVVHDFVYVGKGKWKNGYIYDPDNGKTYRCKARLEGDTLKLRGFIGVSLLGRNTIWTRVEEPEQSASEPE